MEEPVVDVKREFYDDDEDDEQSVDSSTVALNLADADRQSAASGDDMAEVRADNTEPSQCPSPDLQSEMANELPKDKQQHKSVASDNDHQQSADSSPMSNDHHHNHHHDRDQPENLLQDNHHQENHHHHHRDAENGSSTSSGENRSMTGTLAESLLESSKMALADIALREKRCRVFERESNELKDVICSMNHVVHILENIKRVSRDYIHYLYELIGCTIRQDNDQIEQLQQEILELEAELKQWERKYHVMSSFNASNGSLASIGTAAAFLAGVTNNNNNNETETSNHGGLNNAGPNNGGPNNNGTNNASSSASSENQLDHGDDDHLDEHENAESGDIEMDTETNHRHRSQSVSLASNGTNSVGGGVLIPQELCEMSMETQDNEQATNGTVQHTQHNNELDNVVQSKLASSSSSSVINQRAAQHNNRATQQARAAAAAAAAAAAFIMNPTGTHHSAASSPLIAAAMAAASAASASSDKASSQHKLNTLNSLKQQFKSSLNSSSGSNVSTSQSSHDNRHHNGIVPNGHNSAQASASAMTNGSNQPVQITSKPLFLCDHPGCNYQTNMRQRLAMHKRAHAGEMLFSCDIPGCGYQSNYKGNIKIHKKHRHRIESGGEQSSYLVTDNNGNNQKFRTRGRKRKANQIVPPGMMSSSQSSSAAGHQLVMSSIRGQQLDMMKSFMGGGRPSVIVGEDGVEAFTEDGQNSSGEMYSGNESGAKESDMPLYHCTVDGCHYRSKWKQCLTAHQFLHAGVKPYKCDYPGCNYRTNFKGNVNVHKRVHRASEFQCKFAGCSFSTPWKNSFMIHQRNHLPTVVPSPSSAITPVKGSTTTPISGLGPQSNGPIDSDVPLSLSMGGRRRVEAPSPNVSIEGRSTSTRLINIDSPTLPSIESLNGVALPTTAENILNGLNALHQSQSQTSSRTMSATTMSSLMANGQFINGHRMKQEEDDDDVSLDEDEEDEIDDDEDEEMMVTFGGGEHGNSSETAAANHAFLMAEAASAVVSQASAVHLAALRHSVNSAQNDSLRAGMMFDLSRYHQEMI